jgi:uncharacterized membrane protein
VEKAGAAVVTGVDMSMKNIEVPVNDANDGRLQDEIELSEKLFRTKYDRLGKQEKHVAHHIAEKSHIARNVTQGFSEKMTFGQRLADKVAAFGGSWTFISLFAIVLVVWIILNSFILIRYSSKSFDPYPYILLNLFLSMLAAIQAPIILMSQNRQAYKDRMSAEHDYEVNLKAELEILTLHEKIDLLREEQWSELISIQQKQLTLLGQLTNTSVK